MNLISRLHLHECMISKKDRMCLEPTIGFQSGNKKKNLLNHTYPIEYVYV